MTIEKNGVKMKDNLEIVFHILEDTDSIGEKSLFFYNNPVARQQFLHAAIAFSVQQTGNILESQQKKQEILEWIDKRFQEYTWPAHETHFHTNFMQHCDCPFTCLKEIDSIIEKLSKEKFAA